MDQIAMQTDGTCIGRETCVVYVQKQAEEVCTPSDFATTITAPTTLRLWDQWSESWYLKNATSIPFLRRNVKIEFLCHILIGMAVWRKLKLCQIWMVCFLFYNFRLFCCNVKSTENSIFRAMCWTNRYCNHHVLLLATIFCKKEKKKTLPMKKAKKWN